MNERGLAWPNAWRLKWPSTAVSRSEGPVLVLGEDDGEGVGVLTSAAGSGQRSSRPECGSDTLLGVDAVLGKSSATVAETSSSASIVSCDQVQAEGLGDAEGDSVPAIARGVNTPLFTPPHRGGQQSRLHRSLPTA
ncbi:hypothetical protein, partial [Nonomuraea sp. LPB2021202275-12-8]|uniref:hypothetical protein n=1 Tax=Nonomuraea sp. LPB2021202275-12-8 TaxID=3120159 RepID=UPI00300C4FE8